MARYRSREKQCRVPYTVRLQPRTLAVLHQLFARSGAPSFNSFVSDLVDKGVAKSIYEGPTSAPRR